MEPMLLVPRLKQMGSYRLALTRGSGSACLFTLALQFSGCKYRKHLQCTEHALLQMGP